MKETNVVDIFKAGGIIAYPTEAVFGLGCDPDNEIAIKRLLELKKRQPEKGLILLASNYAQLLPYIAVNKIPQELLATILARWPNGVTQIVPKSSTLSPLLSGNFDTIAVRITNQPDVVSLCHQTDKPIVSTSANLSGKQPAKTWKTLDNELVNKVDFIIKGDTLGHTAPSKIIDAITENVIRQ